MLKINVESRRWLIYLYRLSSCPLSMRFSASIYLGNRLFRNILAPWLRLDNFWSFVDNVKLTIRTNLSNHHRLP